MKANVKLTRTYYFQVLNVGVGFSEDVRKHHRVDDESDVILYTRC